MTATTQTRTWTIAVPAPIPMKSANVRDHWRVVARERRTWREAAFGRIALARLPRGLTRIRVEVEFHFNTNRRRDAPNYMESVVKPCVDAIGPERRVPQGDGSFRVDRGWGVVPDDTAEYVDLRPPTIGTPVAKGLHPYGLVVLTITDLSGDPSDTFCHTVRDDDPCVLRAHDGDVHEDPDGTEYRSVPLAKKGVSRG